MAAGKSAIFQGWTARVIAVKEIPVTISRRQFVSASSLSVAALGLARLPVLGQAGAQAPAAQAPPVTRFEDIRRGVGFFTGNGGTIGYLVNGDGAIAIDSQFMPTAEICVAGLKQRAPKGIDLLRGRSDIMEACQHRSA